MIGKPKNMKERRQRHYNDTKTILAVAMIIMGVCAGVCFTLLWPQLYISQVFNSRLAHRAVMNSNDYYTCSKDYVAFVLDEPGDDTYLLSFYVFSVTNPADVFQRGYKPTVKEQGPFGFLKRTYKYDIYFNPIDSSTVTYKEYSYLEEVTDSSLCEKMFYRLNRDYIQTDPCANGVCLCKDSSVSYTVVNPLFLKFLWKETPHLMLAYYSLDVFQNVQALLGDPFTEAVKAHMVTYAYQEIFLFRVQMHVYDLLLTAYDYFLGQGWSISQIALIASNPTYCGLDIYGINECVFAPHGAYQRFQSITNLPTSYYPKLDYFFNTSHSISFLNTDTGLPRWLSVSWHLGYAEFNSLQGYSTISHAEVSKIATSFTLEICNYHYNTTNKVDFTADEYRGCYASVQGIAYMIGNYFLVAYSVKKSILQSLAYKEFLYTSAPVICAPTLHTCIWQWGYMVKHYPMQSTPYNMTLTVAQSLIDNTQQISTNPNHVYQTSNAEHWYNVYLYYNHVYVNDNPEFNIDCTHYPYTLFDAHTRQPAGLWAYDHSVSTANLTYVYVKYNATATVATKQLYFQLAWRIANLMQVHYRNATDFHDIYVIRYLNKYKDSALQHNFTVGNWSDLGYAQFAGGYVTQAIASVRTIKQINRNGMWRIGADNLYIYYYEYAAWAVLEGNPYTWLTTVSDAKRLLAQLARDDDIGVSFREHIFYRGSTFIGDGIHYSNGVGNVGEVTFAPEANYGNFSCSFDAETEYVCGLLDNFHSSSAAECASIETLYDSCTTESQFNNNFWINITACAEFETSATSPTQGIQCDSGYLFGRAHPYTKSRGNIVYSMMYALTLETALLEGLWCESTATCDFSWGGMFTTTTPRKLLFEGYTEASILKYLNLKYAKYHISFECQNTPYDVCGKQLYHCDNAGVIMKFPNESVATINDILTTHKHNITYQEYHIRYNETKIDDFFTYEYFLDRNSSSLLWPHSMNTKVARESQVIANNQSLSILTLPNPYWTAYPAWNNALNSSFLKYYQCSKRMFLGSLDHFQSCEITLDTGLASLSQALNLRTFYGNSTIHLYGNVTNSTGFVVNGTVFHNQFPMSQWLGFSAYEYTYQGLSAGPYATYMTIPSLFTGIHNFNYQLSQKSLQFQFQRDIPLSLPFSTGPNYPETTSTTGMSLASRRFVEDQYTWQPYRTMGKSYDSYGMTYTIPIGMSRLSRFTDFPVFLDTPHSYGNEKWGGIEYTFVLGTVQNEYGQRTFIDYDPVTGKAIRSATRQQINVRIEASALFPNAFSSQQRCVAPSKSYAYGSGYGCFAYVPIYWMEEAVLLSRQEFYQLYDHYYTRPARGQMLTNAGIAMAALCIVSGLVLLINEMYYRRKFHARVYID